MGHRSDWVLDGVARLAVFGGGGALAGAFLSASAWIRNHLGALVYGHSPSADHIVDWGLVAGFGGVGMVATLVGISSKIRGDVELARRSGRPLDEISPLSSQERDRLASEAHRANPPASR